MNFNIGFYGRVSNLASKSLLSCIAIFFAIWLFDLKPETNLKVINWINLITLINSAMALWMFENHDEREFLPLMMAFLLPNAGVFFVIWASEKMLVWNVLCMAVAFGILATVLVVGLKEIFSQHELKDRIKSCSVFFGFYFALFLFPAMVVGEMI